MADVSDSPPVPASETSTRLVHFAIAAVGALVVLGLRLALASGVGYCGSRDACFYETLARQLAQHHGFVVPFVWNYQVGDIALPNPALAYWRPGMSLILALPAAFCAGVTLLSAAVLDTLATLALSLSAAWLAWRTTADRAVALSAWLLCLLLAPLWTMPLTPDAALFYAAAVAWFLALIDIERRSLRVELLGVAMGGVAYFIRNDAILLGAALAAILARRLAVARGGARGVEFRRAAALCVAFLLALVPTHMLLYAASSHFLNSAIDRVMFLGNLDEFRRYGSPVDFATWSAPGLAALVKLRIVALFATLRGIWLLCGQFPTLLALLGAAIVATRRRREYGARFIAPAVFLAVLVGSYVMALPVIAAHAVPRSATALLPCAAVLAVIAAREIATSPRLATAAVAIAAAFSVVHGLSMAQGLIGRFHGLRARYESEARLIEAGAAQQRRPPLAMVEDPAPFTATTGIPSVPLPSNGLAATKAAIAHYGVTDVVADEWRGGRRLARALGASAVAGVPGTTDIVITVPRRSSGQNGATASR